jgi:hypothetical protein
VSTIADVPGLLSTLASLSVSIAAKVDTGHTHLQTDVTGLVSALSTKSSVGHTHAQSEVTGLESTMANLAAQISTRAAGVHTHAQSDVTGLTSTIANLAAQISTRAAGSHTHAQADVTDLTSTLAALTTALSTKASLASGLVPTAQLGSSGASSAVFLRGDQVWAAPTAAASGVIPSTWAVLSTHVLTGSTTMQSVTGLSFAVSSASVYRFEFTLGWHTLTTTTGIALGVNGPASPTLLAYEWAASTGLGLPLGRTHRTFGAQQIAVAGSSAVSVDMYGYLGGVVRTGVNAGTVQLQYASEVAGSTVSVRAGSVGFLFGPL